MSLANRLYQNARRSVPGILFALLISFMIPGCGGGDKAGTTAPSSTMPPPSTGTEFADLNPTNAGYAATAVSRAADARPRPGSITQSSNVNDGITVDRVTVTAQYGATRNNYSVRNGSSWSISTSDGNAVSIPGITPPFKGSELTKRVNGGTLYVDVVSDIEAPASRQVGGGDDGTVSVPLGTRVPFPSAIGAEPLRISSTNANIPGTWNGQSGAFRCMSGCSYTGNRLAAGAWTFTPTRPPGAVDVPESAPVVLDSTARPVNTARTPGRFNGQPGYFRCLSNSCGTQTRNSVTTLTGQWIFIPAGGGAVTTPDADYLAGGLWLFVPDGATSADDVVFGAFGDGGDPFRQGSLLTLQGTARYVGAATGVYSARSSSVSELGYWDGDVTLTADFGGRSDLGTISGSVTGIEVDDERSSGSVSLGTASIGSSHSGFFEGRVSGVVEGRTYTGRWGGQFFGNGEADGKPGSVGGTLGGRSTSTDGTVSFVGVFGAYRQ